MHPNTKTHMWNATLAYVTLQILIPYLHKRKYTTFFHRFYSSCRGSWYVLCFILYTYEICHIFVQNIRHITNEFLFPVIQKVMSSRWICRILNVDFCHLSADRVSVCHIGQQTTKYESSAAGQHSTTVSTRSIHTPHCRYLERSTQASRHCASCCASLRDARRHTR